MFISNIEHILKFLSIIHHHVSLDRRGDVEVERSPHVREIGVRSPVATDPVVKTGNDSSTAKRSATGVCITGTRRCPCCSRCGTFENPHCSMAMSAEHRSKFVSLEDGAYVYLI